MMTTRSLDHSDAWRALEAVVAEANRRGKAVAVAVVDPHGEMIGALRMDGTKLTALAVALNKAHTAARIREETRDLGRRVRDRSTGFDVAYFGDPRIVGWGGGVPVIVDGDVLGAVGVSGLTEIEDAELATAGIGALSS